MPVNPEEIAARAAGLMPGSTGQIGKPLKHIRARAPGWLWRPYVPLGGMTIVEGDPGTGKSTLLAWLAAQVSNGWKHFHSIRPRRVFRSGIVVMCSMEDNAAAVIAPRLIAADADPDRVAVLDTDFNLNYPDRLAGKLEGVVAMQKPILLILDPITSFMGYMDTSRSGYVRSALRSMLRLARERGFAVVVSRHLVKSHSGRKITRGEGSLGGFAGQARSMLQVEEVERGLFRVEHIKSNYARYGFPFHYRIEEVEVDEGPEDWLQSLQGAHQESEVEPVSEVIRTSRVAFVQVDEKPVGVRQPEKEPTKTEQAVALLKDLLDRYGGRVAAREVMEAAKAQGLTVTKPMWGEARRRLGVESRQPTREELEDWGVIQPGEPMRRGHWWILRESRAT